MCTTGPWGEGHRGEILGNSAPTRVRQTRIGEHCETEGDALQAGVAVISIDPVPRVGPIGSGTILRGWGPGLPGQALRQGNALPGIHDGAGRNRAADAA